MKEKQETLAQLMYGEPHDEPKWVWLMDQSDKALCVMVLPPACGGKDEQGNDRTAFTVDFNTAPYASAELPRVWAKVGKSMN